MQSIVSCLSSSHSLDLSSLILINSAWQLVPPRHTLSPFLPFVLSGVCVPHPQAFTMQAVKSQQTLKHSVLYPHLSGRCEVAKENECVTLLTKGGLSTVIILPMDGQVLLTGKQLHCCLALCVTVPSCYEPLEVTLLTDWMAYFLPPREGGKRDCFWWTCPDIVELPFYLCCDGYTHSLPGPHCDKEFIRPPGIVLSVAAQNLMHTLSHFLSSVVLPTFLGLLLLWWRQELLQCVILFSNFVSNQKEWQCKCVLCYGTVAHFQ